MNLESQEQKDLNLANCIAIHSFEDKILIQIFENKIVTQKLFKLTEEGELELLDEKTNSEYFGGCGNLGILDNEDKESVEFWLNGKRLLDFSSGKLVFTKDKEKDRKYIYNSLVGPTEYPEVVEEICQKHLKY